MKDKKEIQYADRETLDEDLEKAIAEIVAAEGEAALILEKAETTSKSTRLDGAARERTLREAFRKQAAAEKDKAVADAAARAEADCSALYEKAQKQGAELISSKSKDIDKVAKELFSSLCK